MIAAAIAEYIKKNGIKQTFICEKTGLSKNSISFALKEKRKLSIEEYVEICHALNVPYDYFFKNALSKTPQVTVNK
jgi:transcriptional regulator with XRE-family HTH domain